MKQTVVFVLLCVSFGISNAQKVVVKGRKPAVTRDSTMQHVYSMDQLIGKWQEVRRRDVSGNGRVAFTDSLQLNFNKRDSVIVRDGITMSQRGFANVVGNKLNVAGDNYSILSLSKNTLVINDGEYMRDFIRRKNFYYENMGKITIPRENISDPVAVDHKKLTGKWYVYRTQAMPGVAEDSAIIKSIKILHNSSGALTGEITFTKNTITQTVPFQATIQKGLLHLTADMQGWQLHTYKADGKEFIFGNQGGLVYFSKKL